MTDFLLHCFAQPVRLTIAYIPLCGYLFWPEEIGIGDWSAYPGIDGWLKRIGSHPRWVHPYELVPGHPRPAAK